MEGGRACHVKTDIQSLWEQYGDQAPRDRSTRICHPQGCPGTRGATPLICHPEGSAVDFYVD